MDRSFLKKRLSKFKKKDVRLDRFWMDLLNNIGEDCDNFKIILKITLIISHGQANIERGFSVNAECVVENMLEETLVDHGMIYDTATALGEIAEVPITKKLILETRNAYSRYTEVQ